MSFKIVEAMFDITKNNIKGISITDLSKNHLLDFKLVVDEKTAVIHKKKALYKKLSFIITNETFVNLNGSLHYYFNDGKHNYNDFTISNLVEVLTDLSSKFRIDPFAAYLRNLEFGVNLSLPFETKMFLNSILSYKGNEPLKENFNGEGNSIRFSSDHYDFKIYDKGLQNDLSCGLLRIEIKVKKMQYFKSKEIDISRLSDLLNQTNYDKLKKHLLKAFSDLVIYDDSIILEGLSEKEKELLINGSNPKYWIQAKKNDPNSFKYERICFRELVLKCGKQNLQNTVYDLIENKWDEITKSNIETDKKIAEYLSQFSSKDYPN